MPTKRDLVLDAAIQLLGTRGSKGLTHRGVDEIAELPKGSTSNYFRTREALIEGVLVRLVERDRFDWDMLSRMPVPQTVDELIDGSVAWVLHSVGPDRVRTAARYALFLEAAASEPLQGPLSDARRSLVSWVGAVLTNVSAEPEVHCVLLMDYLEAVVLHQLALPVADFDPRLLITRMARALLGEQAQTWAR